MAGPQSGLPLKKMVQQLRLTFPVRHLKRFDLSDDHPAS
jgi:hypothetical protein